MIILHLYHTILLDQIIEMETTASVQHLLSCLSARDKYTGTRPYLQKIKSFNQEVIQIINQALLDALFDKKHSPMTQLLALRLFKDLLVTGNFTAVDQIDEKVEELVVNAAQYKSNKKEVGRGATYFTNGKAPKEQEIAQLGSSFVIMATEIVAMGSRWCTEDDNRYDFYYEELQKRGVTFPEEGKYTFLKAKDKQDYNANYAKWKEWFEDHEDQIEREGSKKRIGSNKGIEKPEPPTIQVAQSQQLQVPKIQGQLKSKVQTNIKAPEVKKQVPEVKDKAQSSQKKAEDIKKLLQEKEAQEKKIKEQYQQNQRRMIDQNKAQTEALKKQIGQLSQASKKMEDQLVNSEEKNASLSKQLSQIKVKSNEQEKITESIRSQLSTYKQALQKEQKAKQQLKGQLQRLKMTQSIQKRAVKEEKKVQKHHQQCQVTSQPSLNELELSNKQLKELLQKSQSQSKQWKEQAEGVLSKNEELLQRIEELEKKRVMEPEPIGSLKPEESGPEPVIRPVVRGSLVIQDEQKENYPILVESIEQTDDYKTKTLHRDCSVSEYLKNNDNQRGQSKPRSLKKTESQHRFAGTHTISNKMTFHNDRSSLTTGKLQKRAEGSRLYRTGQSFMTKSKEQSSKVVTVFPQLRDYFPQLSFEYLHFKAHCLGLRTNQPFFENDMIKVYLQPVQPRVFVLSVHNKTDHEQKIRLLSGSSCIELNSVRSHKTRSNETFDCTVTLKEADLNLRYPKLSVILGNRGISLTNTLTNTFNQQKVFHLLLPITLYNFCDLKRIGLADLQEADLAQYYSQDFIAEKWVEGSAVLKEIKEVSNSNCGGLNGRVELGGNSVNLLMPESRTSKVICSFEKESQGSSDLAKVMLQVLSHLLNA